MADRSSGLYAPSRSSHAEAPLHVEDRSVLKRSVSIGGRFVTAGLAFLALAGAQLASPEASPPPSSLSAAELQALDLGKYVVTDPSASYFEVEARRAFLRDTPDPLLRAASERLGAEVDCEEKLALPVIDYELRLPSVDEAPEAWRAAIEPLFAFDDAVSDLAAAGSGEMAAHVDEIVH